jgi:YfiR/HmsC-like
MTDPASMRHAAAAKRLARTAFALILALVPAAAGRAAVLAPAAGIAASEGERALERRVKAAFLYRFTEFVTWPEAAFARAESPFTIVVVGRDAFADELRQTTAGRTVQGRAVEVRRIGEGEAMPAAQMVFIPESEKPRLREWIRQAPRQALVVTEAEDALGHGSVINFILVEGRVRFEISLESAEKRGLRMSSRLLAIAQGVRTGTP